MLADGSLTTMSTCDARLSWNGYWRDVVVVQSYEGPLIGMNLIWGSLVTIQAWEGGDVSIEVRSEL